MKLSLLKMSHFYKNFSYAQSLVIRLCIERQINQLTWQVLYLIEPIDEVAIQNLQTYKEKKFVDISKEDLELGEWSVSFASIMNIKNTITFFT